MYIKIKGNLLDILGEKARVMDKIGLTILPQHQMIDKEKNFSYGICEEKLNFIAMTQIENVTYFETIEEVNADIVAEYEPQFQLVDIDKLKLDLELSGGIDSVVGYDKLKALDSQKNLMALLYNGDMAGITVNKIAELFK